MPRPTIYVEDASPRAELAMRNAAAIDTDERVSVVVDTLGGPQLAK